MDMIKIYGLESHKIYILKKRMKFLDTLEQVQFHKSV
jgi:hypothetical protein